ncbi:MAG: hypothetical protein RLZZ450_2620 [Pseudomonadota bacterium]
MKNTKSIAENTNACKARSTPCKRVTEVAAAVRKKTGLACSFLPLWVVRAAGILPCPKRSVTQAARFDEKIYVVFFDESWPNWEGAVVDVACGSLLREYGLADTSANRQLLAGSLTVSTDVGATTKRKRAANVKGARRAA